MVAQGCSACRARQLAFFLLAMGNYLLSGTSAALVAVQANTLVAVGPFLALTVFNFLAVTSALADWRPRCLGCCGTDPCRACSTRRIAVALVGFGNYIFGGLVAAAVRYATDVPVVAMTPTFVAMVASPVAAQVLEHVNFRRE